MSQETKPLPLKAWTVAETRVRVLRQPDECEKHILALQDALATRAQSQEAGELKDLANFTEAEVQAALDEQAKMDEPMAAFVVGYAHGKEAGVKAAIAALKSLPSDPQTVTEAWKRYGRAHRGVRAASNRHEYDKAWDELETAEQALLSLGETL